MSGYSGLISTEPYVRLFHQLRNVMELMEMLMRRKPQEDLIRVHLVTGLYRGDASKQRENLGAVVTACDGTGIDFTWAYDGSGTAHARHIVTDTG